MSARVLYVAPRLPHPGLDREQVRPYHQLRALALRYDVHLLTTGEEHRHPSAVAALRRFCDRVELVPEAPSRVAPASARHVVTHRPLVVGPGGRRPLGRRLRELVCPASGNSQAAFDLLFLHGAGMVPHGAALPRDAGPARVCDLVGTTSARWREMADGRGVAAGALFRREADRLADLERTAVLDNDRVLVASEWEAERLRDVSGADRSVVAVPTPAPPHAPLDFVVDGRPSALPTLLFTGNLDHLPSAEAAEFLATDVFPLVRREMPDAQLRIVGRRPSLRSRALGALPGVSVDAGPTDPRRHHAAAWLAVVPHRVTGGVRNEILEALSLGVPVVCTPRALAGLDFRAGREVAVAAGRLALARTILGLLRDARTREAMAYRGRRALLAAHDHDHVATLLEETVQDALRASAGRSDRSGQAGRAAPGTNPDGLPHGASQEPRRPNPRPGA